ncbi:MAG: hypothetical protein ACI8UO_005144 [Verrucomicrobiales bacterium]|jgi:hypothetical protein
MTRIALGIFLSIALTNIGFAQNVESDKSESKTLSILFIGNSYTARHNLAKVVKSMAEAGNSDLTVEVTSIIYGGRRLVDHWRLGTQNFVRLSTLTADEQEATITSLEEAEKEGNRYAKGALTRHRNLLTTLEEQRTTWDVVVLQSYRDDLDGEKSLYMKYAPKFAELIQAQGGRVILYETTPNTQNAESLTAAPEPEEILTKAKSIAALTDQINAKVAPMSLVGLRCQTERPDFTLRFINDAHLNHTMAYLTACSIYAALFDKSPVGLSVDSITDIRFLNDKERDKDRDGAPITRTFGDKDRADLQRIAWESYQYFENLRGR